MSDIRDTRQRLLEATISIIETEGEDGVRVDRVAELAGFTKPVVYHHFSDREDLVVAALSERYFRSISFAMEDFKFAAARCRSAEQFRTLLKDMIVVFRTEEGAHRRQLRIEALGAAVSRPALQESLTAATRRQVHAFGEILQIAEDEGWLRVGVDPVDFAMWWVGMILGRHLVEIDSQNFAPEQWDAVVRWLIDQSFAEA